MKIPDRILIVVFVFQAACNTPGNPSDFFQDSDSEILHPLEINTTDLRLDLKNDPQPESQYSDVFKKNLFNPDRSFTEVENEETPEPPTVETPRSAIDVPSLELVGTLMTSYDVSYAFIRNSADKDRNQRNKVIKYELGQWIGDYLISEIETNKVTLIKGEETAIIRLKVSDNTNPRGSTRATGRSPPARAQQSSRRSSRDPQFDQEPMNEEEKKKAEAAMRMKSASTSPGDSSSGDSRQEQGGFTREPNRWSSRCGSSKSRSVRSACGR